MHDCLENVQHYDIKQIHNKQPSIHIFVETKTELTENFISGSY